MEFLRTPEIPEPFKTDILNLWNKEYPQHLSYNTLSDFNNYLKTLIEASHILIIKDNKVLAWYVNFIRNRKKWFVILLNSNIQGKGYGTQLINLAKKEESELNGWVIEHDNDLKQNGEKYKSPLGFYLKNGFEVISEDRLELETISAVRIRWQHFHK